MPTPEISIWLPAAAALAGGLIASIAPVVTGLLNSRAEARRERLRLAVQLAIEDHKHLLQAARETSKAKGVAVGVPPISAVFGYHTDILRVFARKGYLTAEDFVDVRNRNKAVFEALKSLGEESEGS